MVFVVILINRVRCNVDVVRAIIDDVVVPQDVALAVERRLVVVLADVVRRLQIIAIGFAVVAIVDGNVVRVAIDERRVGRHVARIQFNRAIDRVDALAVDYEISRINIDITRTAIFVCYFFYIVILGAKPRSSNRVRSNIIGIAMTFTIRRNGAICIQLECRHVVLHSSFCFELFQNIALSIPRCQIIEMQQIVLCKFVINGVAIAIYGVNIICTKICCSLLQKNLA